MRFETDSQIRRVTAVDERGRENCIGRGFAPDLVEVVPNAVDLARFKARGPLPERPVRALAIAKTMGHMPAIRAACAEAGLALDEVGFATSRVSDRLEVELPNYDLVFASGRSALEAAAVGCAVVVVDGTGFAGLFTSDRVDSLRRGNLGVAVLRKAVTQDGILDAIRAYDAEDAARVAARIRAEAASEAYAAAYLRIYQAAIEDPPPNDPSVISAATARWLEDLLPTSTDRPWRAIAAEIGHMAAARDASALMDMERRLIQRLDQLPSMLVIRAAAAAYRRIVPLPLRQTLRSWRGAA